MLSGVSPNDHSSYTAVYVSDVPKAKSPVGLPAHFTALAAARHHILARFGIDIKETGPTALPPSAWPSMASMSPTTPLTPTPPIAHPESHQAAMPKGASYIVASTNARDQIHFNPEMSRRAGGVLVVGDRSSGIRSQTIGHLRYLLGLFVGCCLSASLVISIQLLFLR